MSEIKKHHRARRRLLQGIVGGSGSALLAAKEWHKPVINAVLLPAHAQTSPPATNINCQVSFASDLPSGEFIIDEGNTTVDAEDMGTTGVASWDPSSHAWTPRVTISPASSAGDVTLSVAVESGPGSISDDPSGPPANFDTDTGQAVWDAGDTSSVDTDEVSILSWTFSAPDADDCVVQLTFTGD